MNKTKHLKVLILEDIKADADLAKLQFAELDFNCEFRVCDNKADYTRLLDEFNPELIISDFSLPKFTGLEALDIFLARDELTPFIFVTGTLSIKSAVEAIKAGATDFIIKSQIDQLPAAVIRAFRGKQEKEKKLALRKERDEILKSITDGFFAVDLNWNVTYCNNAAEKLLHVSWREILNTNFWNIFNEADKTKYFEKYDQGLKQKKSGTVEAFFSTFNVWAQISAFPKNNGMAIFFKDITKEKTQALEILKMKQNTEALINSTEDFIFSIDAGFNLVVANQAFQQIYFDFTNRSLEAGKPLNYPGMPRDIEEKWQQYVVRALAGEQFTETVESNITGVTKYMLASFNPIVSADGNCTGAACFIKDITERTLNLKTIEERNESLREIAWTQSHVVRAPLARIKWLISLLEIEDSSQKEIMDYINQSADELDGIVQDIIQKTENIDKA